MKNLPTLLTLFRIAMGPVIGGLVLWAASELYSDRILAGLIYALAVVLFVIAAITDWVDGWLARKLDAVTPMGAALDHTADKVLIACVLVALAYAALPLQLTAAVIIILGRDIAIGGLREGLANQGRALPVAQLGKWKAAAEMAGVGAFLAYECVALLQFSANVIVGLFYAACILIWIAAALALLSAALYALRAINPDGRTQPN
jgi:CDP-diacylglycerol--glycerol-3-phosphate 3-phosphatidyltransferase